jgi:surfactin family lipopeptide synthetase C
MPKQNIEAIYPLSPIQQGILFHSLYAPDSGVYLEQTCCELRGNLDVPAFQRAWEMIIDRHATLRTAFVWEGMAKPLQAVGGRVRFRIDEIDWRDFSREEQQKQIELYLAEDRRRGFDLHRAPLMRVTVMRLSDAAYYFVWSHHHIVMDGWSSPVLMKDLFSFYQALVRAEEPAPERSRPYSDYIEWLNKQDLEAAGHYWRKQLRGFRAATPLSVNGDGSHVPVSGSYGEAQVCLSEDTTETLKGLAKAHHLTLNTVVEGSWAVLLSLYSR